MEAVLREMLLQGEMHAHTPARRLVWLHAAPPLLQARPQGPACTHRITSPVLCPMRGAGNQLLRVLRLVLHAHLIVAELNSDGMVKCLQGTDAFLNRRCGSRLEDVCARF